MRVALLTNILPPYRLPAFRALARTPGWRLRVFLNARTEFDRSWDVDFGGLDVEVLRGAALPRGDHTLHLPTSLPGALARFAPDAIVSGELGARTALAALYAAVARVPLVVWVESTRARAAASGRLRRLLGPALLSRAGAAVVPGREARRLLRAWGVPDARIFDAPNACDGETFAKALAGLDHEASGRNLRAGLGARPHIALAVGRLLPVKGVAPLLAAWERLPPDLRRDWTLLFVGSGPLAARVRAAGARRPAGEILHVPALPPRELAALYAAADLMVFPSLGDVWGIAVHEAMTCGLPVLCSRLAGCAEDLVTPGRDGWLADPRDTGAFADALREALTCGDREPMGRSARETAGRFTPDAMAEGMRRAVRLALAGSRAA